MLKEEKFNPLQAICIIGAGICLIIVRFTEGVGEWSSVDILKAGVGVVLVGYGIFKLITKSSWKLKLHWTL